MTQALPRALFTRFLFASVVLGGALLAGAAVLWAPRAWAEGGVPGTTNGVLTGPVVGTAQTGQTGKAQPAALPGAHRDNAEPAPRDRAPTDMHPNEALFDSISRGDIAAAREALGRGADLNARNVLGLSPIDLSIDLGRNDITFLLLSQRGASGGAAPPAGTAPAPAQTAHRPQRSRAPATAAARPAPPPASRQYADTPGTPVPEAGFLGFGVVTR